jgi:hypothetical protein
LQSFWSILIGASLRFFQDRALACESHIVLKIRPTCARVSKRTLQVGTAQLRDRPGSARATHLASARSGCCGSATATGDTRLFVLTRGQAASVNAMCRRESNRRGTHVLFPPAAPKAA